MTGVIVLDKPEDFTSFDAVAITRRLAKERKIGHTGTLDPMATGVLPLLLGKGTKTASLLPDTSKSYEASFTLGILTDTEDVTGKTISEDEVEVPLEALEEIMEKFTGDIWQTPPMYSAVSVGGKRLYELARQGIEVEREKRMVNIAELELLDYDQETRSGKIKVFCSKGTYIRTLINDIGKSLHCVGGIMTALRRTYACGFSLEDAVTLEELKKLSEENNVESVLRPIEKLFEGYPCVSVTKPQEIRFCNGGELDLARLKISKENIVQDREIKVMGSEFLGIGKIDIENNQLKIVKILIDKE